jgi:hypothetical protein
MASREQRVLRHTARFAPAVGQIGETAHIRSLTQAPAPPLTLLLGSTTRRSAELAPTSARNRWADGLRKRPFVINALSPT